LLDPLAYPTKKSVACHWFNHPWVCVVQLSSPVVEKYQSHSNERQSRIISRTIAKDQRLASKLGGIRTRSIGTTSCSKTNLGEA
jgi:hypothetical protein